VTTLTLDSVVIEGFKSFAVKTEIKFSARTGLKFIGGDNQANPALGANGAGKSTVWDAVYWCFYGTSSRGARTAQITNHDMNKPEVQVNLRRDGEAVSVFRSGSPNRLAIDGELVEQTKVDELLGRSAAQFMQSVLFGQGVPLFYDLTVPARGDLLEEVMRIELWMAASDVAGSEVKRIDGLIYDADRALARSQGALDALTDDKALIAERDKWEAEHDSILQEQIAELSNMEKASAVADKDVAKLERVISKFPDMRVANDAITSITRRQMEIEADASEAMRTVRRLTGDIKFYTDNKLCAACQQPINNKFAHKCISTAQQTITELNAQLAVWNTQQKKTTIKLKTLGDEHASELKRQQDIRIQLAKASTEAGAKQREINACAAAIERDMQTTNPYDTQISRAKKEHVRARLAVDECETVMVGLRSESDQAEFWCQAFKRVRLFLIKKIVAVFELEANSAAQVLGLVGWHIAITTEVMNKSGTLRPGVHIRVTAPGDPEAREWSPGELQRVRLAVALGFSALIDRSTGVYWDLEVFDEPSNWLSSRGIENLLECLQHRAELMRKSVYLIDHRALSFAGFSEVWEVRKTSDGSSMHLISRSE
jgi:DNA repair exonuclease SbcCD ATPase subunit